MSKSEEYVMPAVEIGDIVRWFPSADRSAESTDQGYVGIVTKVGIETLNINVFSPASYNCWIKDGVRHMSDPKCQHPELRAQGGWEHTPQTLRLHKLLEELQPA